MARKNGIAAILYLTREPKLIVVIATSPAKKTEYTIMKTIIGDEKIVPKNFLIPSLNSAKTNKKNTMSDSRALISITGPFTSHI